MPPANQPKAKPINLSTKPLKSFNWAKIPPMKASETIWKDIDDEKVHKQLKGEAYTELEELFAAKETKVIDTSNSASDLSTTKEITFLDGKRSQNINIMLKAIKLDPTTIKKAILTVDTKTLPRFALVELLKLVPTDDEMIALKEFESEPQKLASAERFMFEISEINKYEAKLKAMYFSVSFAEYQDDATSMINALDNASIQVVESDKFKQLLCV